MASIIRIKRSSVSGNPTTLAAGELAYSALTNSGANGGDRLYIGIGTETAGNAANHFVIGGKYFTDMIDAATNLNTASTLVKRDASGNFSAGTITAALSGNASTATTAGAWTTARALSLTGDATATLTVDGSVAVSSAVTLATVNANIGTFGGSTAIPVITVNAKGLITAVSTAAISTALWIAGNTGTTTVNVGVDTFTISGGTGVTSTVTAKTVTFSIDATVATLTGIQTISNKTFNAGNTWNGNVIGIAYGGTGTATGSITGTGALTFTAGGTNTNVNLVPNGTGTVDVSSKRITNLAEPTTGTDAATRNYVDNAVAGLTWKAAVNLLSATNIALTGSTNTLSIDGHAALTSLNVGYRILLIGQTLATENGIYVYADNGTTYTLTRSTDAAVYTELIGASVFIEEGTVHAKSGWLQSNHYITSFAGQSWVQFSGAGAYVGGLGLTLTGNTFDVNVAAAGGLEIVADALQIKATVAGAGLTITSGVLNVGGTLDRITVGVDAIDIASTYVGQTSITTLGTIASGTWNATTIGTTKGGTGLTAYAAGDLIYASAANTLSVLAKPAATTSLLTMTALGVPAWSSLSNTGITGVGTITTGAWNATAIGPTYGGTGITTYATGDLLYASAANTLTKLAAGVNGQVLQLVAGVPVWADIDGGTY